LTIIHYLRLLLLGLWLGAAIFFSAAVAPALFGVLRGAGLANANELAGSIVTRLLAVINTSGFAVGLFLLTSAYFAARSGRRLAVAGEMICAAIMIIMTGVSRYVISARMVAIRASLPVPIDQIAITDPRRIEFSWLHRYSVMVMGVAMIAALLAFVFAARGGAGASVRREST
jgi:hypothetical protein